jgi:hypothetical protein
MGLYGDRHLYWLERGERVLSREENIEYTTNSPRNSNVTINVPYSPVLSTASPGDLVVLAETVAEAMERAGYHLE